MEGGVEVGPTGDVLAIEVVLPTEVILELEEPPPPVPTEVVMGPLSI